MKQRSTLSLLLVLALGGIAAVAYGQPKPPPGPAGAQPPTPPKTPPPPPAPASANTPPAPNLPPFNPGGGPLIDPGKLKPLQVSPDLRNALRGKRQVNPQLLQQSLTFRQNIPQLKIGATRRVSLEPIHIEPQPTPQMKQAAATLDPTLLQYRNHITGRYIVPNKSLVLALAVSDHTARQTAIRDQGDRGTCVAHASMAGLESFYKWKNDVTKNLSENHAYHIFMAQEGSTCKADPGIKTWKAANYLTSFGVCNEAAAPYTTDSGVPNSDAGHIPVACANNAPNRFTQTQIMFGNDFGGDAVINANNTNYLESILVAGNDIVYGTYVAGTDWSDGTSESGIVDVQLKPNGDPAEAYGGHAMLLVGYNRAGNYFIFKNSWGADRGHSGYFRLSYEYVQTYGKYGYYIKAATAP